jgi:hypothetical protein
MAKLVTHLLLSGFESRNFPKYKMGDISREVPNTFFFFFYYLLDLTAVLNFRVFLYETIILQKRRRQ